MSADDLKQAIADLNKPQLGAYEGKPTITLNPNGHSPHLGSRFFRFGHKKAKQIVADFDYIKSFANACDEVEASKKA